MTEPIILPPEVIEQLTEAIAQKLWRPTPETIERVTAEQAAKELGMSRVDIYYGLIHKELPIGFAKKKEDGTNRSYFIFRPLLDAFKRGELTGLQCRLCELQDRSEREAAKF